MKNIILIIISFLLSVNCLLGQVVSIKGKIVDIKTKTPIRYASIGFKGMNIGTVSDGCGRFILNIRNFSQLNDNTLTVSCIGYNDNKILIDGKKKAIGKIYLEPTSYELDEVVIKPKNFIRRPLVKLQQEESHR